MSGTGSLFSSLRRRRPNTFRKAYPYVSYEELQRMLDALDAAQAWLEHYDRGKVPAGTIARWEVWRAERDEHPERVREALSRV